MGPDSAISPRFSLMAAYAIPAAAFHSGGVGECAGCHSMHRPDAGTGRNEGPIIPCPLQGRTRVPPA